MILSFRLLHLAPSDSMSNWQTLPEKMLQGAASKLVDPIWTQKTELIFDRDDLNFTNPSAFRLTTPIVAAEDTSSSNRFQ